MERAPRASEVAATAEVPTPANEPAEIGAMIRADETIEACFVRVAKTEEHP